MNKQEQNKVFIKTSIEMVVIYENNGEQNPEKIREI